MCATNSPFGSTCVWRHNDAVLPLWNVFSDPLQDCRLCVQVVHSDVEKALCYGEIKVKKIFNVLEQTNLNIVGPTDEGAVTLAPIKATYGRFNDLVKNMSSDSWLNYYAQGIVFCNK